MFLTGIFFRHDENVRQIELLHAHDYGNMSFDQMTYKLQDVKKNDEVLRLSIQ